MGAEFRVRLTIAASINPEYALFQSSVANTYLILRVLPRFVRGQQRHDEDVLTTIMVRQFPPCLKTVYHLQSQALNIVIRMEPSLRYPSNKNSFFTSQETRSIGAGLVLWRGYFQSLRPAIDRILINFDISTGVMYRSGELIDLALEFLGQSTPNALSPQHGLPDRERLRLQQFISGIKIITPYRDPDRRRLVRKVTRESAQERTFEIGDGQTMTVAQYFQNELNIPLQFPDLICVEVCIIFFLSSCAFSCPVALNARGNSVRTLQGPTRSVRPEAHSPRQD